MAKSSQGRSPSHDIAKEQINEETGVCIACSNGDFPEGAHKCIVCAKNVHLFEYCSYPINSGEEDEEGYGQKRICFNCNKKSLQKTTYMQQQQRFAEMKINQKGNYLSDIPTYFSNFYRYISFSFS